MLLAWCKNNFEICCSDINNPKSQWFIKFNMKFLAHITYWWLRLFEYHTCERGKWASTARNTRYLMLQSGMPSLLLTSLRFKNSLQGWGGMGLGKSCGTSILKHCKSQVPDSNLCWLLSWRALKPESPYKGSSSDKVLQVWTHPWCSLPGRSGPLTQVVYLPVSGGGSRVGMGENMLQTHGNLLCIWILALALKTNDLAW